MELEKEQEELTRLESRLKYAQAVLYCAEVDKALAGVAVIDQRFWIILKRTRTERVQEI